jgi:hypothetical protein
VDAKREPGTRNYSNVSQFFHTCIATQAPHSACVQIIKTHKQHSESMMLTSSVPPRNTSEYLARHGFVSLRDQVQKLTQHLRFSKSYLVHLPLIYRRVQTREAQFTRLSLSPEASRSNVIVNCFYLHISYTSPLFLWSGIVEQIYRLKALPPFAGRPWTSESHPIPPLTASRVARVDKLRKPAKLSCIRQLGCPK